MAQLSWGILGTGAIAKTFAKDLPKSKTGTLVAVGSRTLERAQKFAAEVPARKVHGSYEALLADPDIQAVYVATPHPHHAEWAIRAAEAKKHVLVEKPMGMHQAEVQAIIEAAVANNVFLMEAFMYRCHPQTQKIAELLRSGVLGEVRVIQAAFGFHWPVPYDPKSRLLAAELGGGGILDVGCYPVSMARLIAGAAQGKDFADPVDVKAVGHLGQTGVDEWAVAVLKFPGDILAQVATSVQVNQENVARVFGSKGSLFVAEPWGPSRHGGTSKLVLRVQGKDAEDVVVGNDEPLYALEADTVARYLDARQASAPAMSWEDSLGNARTLDRWRQAIGLQYETERPSSFPPHVARRPLARAPKAVIPSGRIQGVDKPASRLFMGAFGDANLAAVLFDAFFEAGGNGFDTSWWYGQGGTDKVLGRWVKARGVRKDVVILAKGAHTPGCYPQELTRQLLASLEFLQTEYADLYIMHRDNPEIPVGEFVDVLNEHVRAGRIKIFGGSNWTRERLIEANEYAAKKKLQGFSVVSNNFSLARMVNPVWGGCIAAKDAPFVEWLTKTQTPLMVWSSQARGFFVRGDPNDRSDGELANAWYSDDNFERLKRAKELGAERGVTANNIALAYVLAQPFPAYCLIGPQKLSELRTTLPALSVKLTPAEMRWLNLESDKRS
jgi:predicted dehydrogenase/aryl-alcohol dehydrogenase-like predicted oxidoreductase